MSDQALATNQKPKPHPAPLVAAAAPAPVPPAPQTPEQAVTAAIKDLPRIVRPLEQGRLKIAHASECDCGTVWSATLHRGTPFDDCLKDEFWANKAASMHVGDKIWVATDDEKFDAELRITSLRTVGAGMAFNRVSVAVLRFTPITAPENFADIGEFEIKFKGQHLKWCLVRADGSHAREGLETQEDAMRMRRSVSAAKTK